MGREARVVKARTLHYIGPVRDTRINLTRVNSASGHRRFARTMLKWYMRALWNKSDAQALNIQSAADEASQSVKDISDVSA